MNLPTIPKRHVAIPLAALAGLLLADVLYQAGMHVRWRYWIASASALQSAASQPTTRPADTQPSSTQAAATQGASTQTAAARPPGMPGRAEAHPGPETRPGPEGKPVALPASIKRRNVMAEPKPKGHGLTLIGVLGSRAIFKPREGETFGIDEGQSGPGGVKVTKIDGYVVTIEFEGKPENLNLFREGGPGAGPPPGPSGAPGGPAAAVGAGTGGPSTVGPPQAVPDRPAESDAAAVERIERLRTMGAGGVTGTVPSP